LEEKYGKAMRILSSEFLRKRALGYISGSKIEKKSQHIRYRHKFIKAVENPK
jgi:transposase-like protein